MLSELSSFIYEYALFSEVEHPGGEFNAQVAQIGWSPAFQYLNRLDHFKCISDVHSQRLIHIGNECDHSLPDAYSGLNHQLGQMNGVSFLLHESAGAGFHIQHQSVDPFGDFLAHDRCADQRRTLDRAGHVAQRVHLFVGRHDLLRLPHQHHSAIGTRNSFELVERAASVAKAASADHRYEQPPGSHNWRQDERCLVAHSTCGVFVDFLSWQIRPVQCHSRVQHRLGKCRDLLSGHAAQKHSHQPRGHLIIGKPCFCITANNELDFLARELVSVTLLADEIDNSHAMRPKASKAPEGCEK